MADNKKEKCDENKSCAKKQKILLSQKDGSVGIIWRCTDHNCQHFAKEVGPAQCNVCPFRVPQPKLAINVSAVIETVHKKKQASLPLLDVNDTFPQCDDRRKQTVIKCCGQVGFRRVCVCAVAPTNQKEVTESDCNLCPLRTVGGVVVNKT